ncbi:MAG: hypothetical protein OXT71_12490 [Acidobacteriota bacterium]|nr:hypothetical protein [Acidobacteriota bacterium]
MVGEMNRRSCHESPTKHFVHKLIDWDRVSQRLERYPAIRDAFSMEVLRAAEESSPYYCHYMAWRLGTWSVESEGCLANLDNLLASAAELPNWEHEESVLKNGEYATYWSLLWQLQVAAKLRSVGRNVMWGGPAGGPDLSVEVDGKRWHVECHVPRKSYFLLQFLQECLSKILGPSVQEDYPLFAPMPLPEPSRFLDDKLEPYCDTSRREAASAKCVTIVCEDQCSVEVVEEEWDTNESDDTVDERRRALMRWGSPEQHVTAMLKGAVSSKGESNSLGDNHPNVLAVNLLLTNAEAAEYHDRDGNMIAGCAPDLPDALDVLAVANCGIDASVPNLRIAACRSPNWFRAGRWLEGGA